MKLADQYLQADLTKLTDEIDLTVGTNAGSVIVRISKKRDAVVAAIPVEWNLAIEMSWEEAEQFALKMLRRSVRAKDELKRETTGEGT